MSKTFRDWEPDQVWLLPPSLQDLVPTGHVAHFVRDTVRNGLDLETILASYGEERGFPPYHPGMMVALLLYGYSQGVYSSRRIAGGCEERLDFAAVTAIQRPDFRTIGDFRKRHSEALRGLFVQVLRLCREAGLVKLGHVALDGTKIKANASKHKAMSYARMVEAAPKLAAEVAGWLKAAGQADRAEDRRHGAERRGDETPDWVANKQRRLAKIRKAKAALEAEAQAAAADKPPDQVRGAARSRPARRGAPPAATTDNGLGIGYRECRKPPVPRRQSTLAPGHAGGLPKTHQSATPADHPERSARHYQGRSPSLQRRPGRRRRSPAAPRRRRARCRGADGPRHGSRRSASRRENGRAASWRCERRSPAAGHHRMRRPRYSA